MCSWCFLSGQRRGTQSTKGWRQTKGRQARGCADIVLFSPAQPRRARFAHLSTWFLFHMASRVPSASWSGTASRMRKNAASGVLASLRGSPYGLGKRLLQAMGGPGENSLRFASSLAAALLDSLFAHPACSASSQISISVTTIEVGMSFFAHPAR